jgi:hypothetical protein
MDVQPLDSPKSAAAGLEVSRLVRTALWVCWTASMLSGAVKVVTALGRVPGRPLIFDFHAFMIAGDAAWTGRLAKVYDSMTMLNLEQQAGGFRVFMPWNYPPLFGLVLAPFSQLPAPLAFCLFTSACFALFFFALRRLAPASAWLVLVTLGPCAIINLASGQNGFLTAGLFALAATGFVGRKPGQAGLAIGALAYKPHMALVWPALLAVKGRWGTFAIAGAVAVALTGASFLVVGPEPFKACIAASAQMGRNMAAGYYPLYRMTSIYAAALSFHLPAAVALAAHLAVALGVVVAMMRVGPRLPEPAQAGLAIISTVFLSPYFYDYDQPLFGVGLALVLPELSARTTRRELIFILITVAAAQVAGLSAAYQPVHLSIGGLLLLGAVYLMLKALAQAPARIPSRAAMPAPAAAVGAA